MNIKLDTLIPDSRNPRKISKKELERLKQSIQSFEKMMVLRPIIVDEKNHILGGHQRYKALHELGYTSIPEDWVKQVKDFTAKEKKEFKIRDNIQAGTWDFELLLSDWDTALLKDWGIDIQGNNVEEDSLPNRKVKNPFKIKHGDVITLGVHRLMCGDSTDTKDVATLLNGKRPNLMVTDPPYGVKYDANWRNKALRKTGSPTDGRAVGKVTNDNKVEWSKAYKLFPGNIIYCWNAGQHSTEVATNIIDSGFEIAYQIIWVKNTIVIGRGDYHFKHEVCWYAVKKGAKHDWNGGRKQTTVWDIDKPVKSDTGHSTQKPVECMARPIRNNSQEGDEVYDPFVGSGTTIIAAQQLKRIAYGMEILPEYCSIIIQRFKNLFPNIPVLINGKKTK